MDYKYEILSESLVYQGFFKIIRYELDIEYFSGGTSGKIVRECLGKNGRVVCVLPYDPVLKKIVLIEQFRVGAMASGAKPWHLEIVAGFVDKNETEQEALKRELFEEIGCYPKKFEKAHEYFGSPSGSGGRVYLYFAEIDSTECAQYSGLHEEGEDIKVHVFSYSEIKDMMKNGKIDNANSILALQAFVLSGKMDY